MYDQSEHIHTNTNNKLLILVILLTLCAAVLDSELGSSELDRSHSQFSHAVEKQMKLLFVEQRVNRLKEKCELELKSIEVN